MVRQDTSDAERFPAQLTPEQQHQQEIDDSVSEVQERWVDWLTATGYPFDWQGIATDEVGGGKPPCTAEELAGSHWRREHAEGNVSPDDSVEEWLESVRSELGED